MQRLKKIEEERATEKKRAKQERVLEEGKAAARNVQRKADKAAKKKAEQAERTKAGEMHRLAQLARDTADEEARAAQRAASLKLNAEAAARTATTPPSPAVLELMEVAHKVQSAAVAACVGRALAALRLVDAYTLAVKVAAETLPRTPRPRELSAGRWRGVLVRRSLADCLASRRVYVALRREAEPPPSASSHHQADPSRVGLHHTLTVARSVGNERALLKQTSLILPIVSTAQSTCYAQPHQGEN